MTLKTTSDVIEALGGTKAVAGLVGAATLQVVSNWKATGRFPSDTYLLLTEALKKAGKTAPVSLWRMKETPESLESLRQGIG